MSLQDLPPEILEKIFFLLSPSTLEVLKEAAGSEIPARFSQTLEFVLKNRVNYLKLKWTHPSAVDFVRRRFPEKLRFPEDAENLSKMVDRLKSKIIHGHVERKTSVMKVNIPPPPTETVYCLFVDPLSLDVIFVYTVLRNKSQVEFHAVDGSSNRFQVDRLDDVVSASSRDRRFVWLSDYWEDSIAAKTPRLCLREVDFEAAAPPSVTSVPVHGYRSNLQNMIELSDDYAVVRDASTIFVFDFPSLRFAYSESWSTTGAELVGGRLYVIEGKDVVVWDLRGRNVLRRMTWTENGIHSMRLKWPYLFCYQSEILLWRHVDGDQDSMDSNEWNLWLPCPFRRVNYAMVGSGYHEWILVTYRVDDGMTRFLEIFEVSTGKILQRLDLGMDMDDDILKAFVYDFELVIIIFTEKNFTFRRLSFLLK